MPFKNEKIDYYTSYTKQPGPHHISGGGCHRCGDGCHRCGDVAEQMYSNQDASLPKLGQLNLWDYVSGSK